MSLMVVYFAEMENESNKLIFSLTNCKYYELITIVNFFSTPLLLDFFFKLILHKISNQHVRVKILNVYFLHNKKKTNTLQYLVLQ